MSISSLHLSPEFRTCISSYQFDTFCCLKLNISKAGLLTTLTKSSLAPAFLISAYCDSILPVAQAKNLRIILHFNSLANPVSSSFSAYLLNSHCLHGHLPNPGCPPSDDSLLTNGFLLLSPLALIYLFSTKRIINISQNMSCLCSKSFPQGKFQSFSGSQGDP